MNENMIDSVYNTHWTRLTQIALARHSSPLSADFLFIFWPVVKEL